MITNVIHYTNVNIMIQERILLLMRAQGMNPTQFADEIGVQRSSISHILSGRNNPSLDIITKILNRFPDIDSNWLVLGKGSLVSGNASEKKVDYSNSLFDEIPEQEPMLELKTPLITHNKNIEDRIEEIQSKNSPIELVKDVEPLIDVQINQNLISENRVDSPLNEKRITKIIIFYSDNTFEELIKP